MELKECPFCGCEADFDEDSGDGVTCAKTEGSCGFYFNNDGGWTRKEVAALWNRRPSPAPEPGDERNRLTQIFLKCARFKIYIDGNKWCATFDDFEDLQESPVGFGDDEYEAVVALLEDFQ